jgi:hypothetical protein
MVLTLIAAFAFDKVPAEYQMALVGVAVLAAIIGFFPLLTSRPFDSSEESCDDPEAGLEKVASIVLADTEGVEPADLDRKVSAEPILVNLLKSQIISYIDASRARGGIYGSYVHAPGVLLGSYMASWVEKRQERQACMKDVHELIDKLAGTTQKFSVELTNDNTIVVHCEGPGHLAKESSELDAQMTDNREVANLTGYYVN